MINLLYFARLRETFGVASEQLAGLGKHLDPRAEVRPLYELALERSAEHPGALRGLPIELLGAGVMAMAFSGFNGMFGQ